MLFDYIKRDGVADRPTTCSRFGERCGEGACGQHMALRDAAEAHRALASAARWVRRCWCRDQMMARRAVLAVTS